MHSFRSLIFILVLAAGSIVAKPCPKPGSSSGAGAGTSAPVGTTDGLLGKKPTRYCGAHRPKPAGVGNGSGTGGLPSTLNTTTSGLLSNGTSDTQATTPAVGAGVGSGSGTGSGSATGNSTVGAGSSSGSGTDTTGSGSTGSTNPATTPNNSTSTSTTSSAPQHAGGSCPAGFLNVVFNTNAGSLPGWSNNAIWNSLSSAGVSNWIGFSLGNGYNEPAYAGMTPQLDAAQIPICMNPGKVGTCVQSLTGSHPPEYMEIFNEMDYSWEGMTPTCDPQTAANAVPPLFSANTPTKLISPALAYTGSSWLPQFGAACNGCMDKVDIVAGHIYNKDPAQVMNIINQFHNQWPNKKIWLTELAPASSKTDGCTFGDAEMINWMKTLLPQIIALGFVEKVFWNDGAWVRDYLLFLTFFSSLVLLLPGVCAHC